MNGPIIRVLVVDDQAQVREAVSELLGECASIEVVGVAANGAEALAFLGHETVDAVLMDLRMPVMDGLEATRQITAAGIDTAVLIHSAYGDDSFVLEALQAGARGYVVKGSQASDIVSALTTVANGQSHISDEVMRPLVDRLVGALAAERQTRRASEEAAATLIALNARQHEFALQAAHELRTPLTALLGSLEMLEDPAGLTAEAICTLAKSAMDGAQRFGRLTENLEVIATGDLLPIDVVPTSISAVLADVVERLAAQERVDVDAGAIRVAADPGRLRQALHNLIQNALNVSPPNSHVAVTAEVVESNVIVDITDSGPGFDDEMFTSFRQKPDSANGLGVGLTVARALVARMGGSIDVLPRLVDKTTVRMTLTGVFA